MVTLICEWCGDPFDVFPYREDTARFCSYECRGKELAERPNAKASRFTTSDVRGSANPRWKEGVTFTCEWCGDDFQKKPWLVRQNGAYRFCSRDCFESSGCFRGDNSPTWVGGPKTYRGRGWPEARARVVEDQDGDCAGCGEHVGESLPVHHIVPYRDFDDPTDANNRDNLIGLCQSCHMAAEAGGL